MSQYTLRAALTDVFAGTVCSILSIAYCLSYAALIFTGPLEHLLSYGIAVTFLSAAVGGAIVALRSSLTFAVAGPDSSISVVLAALVASLVQRLAMSGGADFLAPALIAMALATALTGLLLCVLGFTHAGRAIRFVPYPVIGGFLGATGWLLITGAIQVVTGRRPALGDAAAFENVEILTKIAAAVAVAVTLSVLLRRYGKNPFVLPGVLLTAFVVTHLALQSTGTTIAAAQDQGWLFRLQPAAGLTLPWSIGALRNFPWSALPQIAGDGLAVIFVTVANFLLNTTGLEIATRSDAHIERDLKVLGLANVIIAALGGYVSCTSFSRSMLVRTAGATQPPRRPDRGGDLRGRAGRRSVVSRLCAQIHSRRPLALSGRRPRLSMARPVVAPLVADRIPVARHHCHLDRLCGLYRRRIDRHRHRLRHFRAECEPRECDQIQL